MSSHKSDSPLWNLSPWTLEGVLGHPLQRLLGNVIRFLIGCASIAGRNKHSTESFPACQLVAIDQPRLPAHCSAVKNLRTPLL